MIRLPVRLKQAYLREVPVHEYYCYNLLILMQQQPKKLWHTFQCDLVRYLSFSYDNNSKDMANSLLEITCNYIHYIAHN